MAKIISFILGCLIFITAPFAAHAASLSFSPSNATVSVGDRTTIKILVSADKSINAISGDIVIPPNMVTIDSVSKSGSILNFWVKEPSISKSTGTIHFEGVNLTGFQGTGTVLTLTVHPTTKGSADAFLQSVQILANDGQGTDITNGVGKAHFTIAAAKPVIPEPEPTVIAPVETIAIPATLDAPSIASPTHPDPSLWYSFNTVQLNWVTGAGLTGIQTALDNQAETNPNGKSEKVISQRVIQNLKDGVSYFHLKFITKEGASDVAHYALRIDTLSPTDLTAKIVPDDQGGMVAQLSALDAISGVDYFLVGLDTIEPEKVIAQNGQASYVLPRYLALGTHTMVIAAYDRARNKTQISIPVTIDHLPAPKLTIADRFHMIGTNLSIGISQAMPDQEAYVFVKKPNNLLETYLVRVDSQGNGVLNVAMNQAGEYGIWSEQTLGQQGIPAGRTTILVHGKVIYHVFRIGQIASPFIVLLLIIGFAIHTWPRKKQ